MALLVRSRRLHGHAPWPHVGCRRWRLWRPKLRDDLREFYGWIIEYYVFSISPGHGNSGRARPESRGNAFEKVKNRVCTRCATSLLAMFFSRGELTFGGAGLEFSGPISFFSSHFREFCR